METSIQALTAVKRKLAEAKTLDDVLDIRDKAEAVRVYAQAAKLGLEIQNEAAEVKIRAERKAGEMLAEMPKASGGQPYQSTGNTMLPVETPTLSDMGIEKMQSSRWQAIASLPDAEFEKHITETKAEGKELTSAGVIRYSKSETAKQDKSNPPPLDGKYRIIYTDPPWKYGDPLLGELTPAYNVA